MSSAATLRTQMSQLRKMLGDQAAHLHTVRGFGYRWDELEPSTGPEHVLDVDGCRILTAGSAIKLTPHQTKILRALTRTQAPFMSVLTLQASTGITSERSVFSHISSLRVALSPIPEATIHAVRGRGYRYAGPPLRHVMASTDTHAAVELQRDGSLRVNWHLLRLRHHERMILRAFLAQLEQPMSYAELLEHASITSVSTLQAAITSLRSALRTSNVSIRHCGPLSGAYMLVRST